MSNTQTVHAHQQLIGEEKSIWFKLTPMLNAQDPMAMLMRLNEKYGNIIPIRLRDETIWMLSDVEHFKRVFITNVDNYGKYFDGLEAIFGNSMITVDGKLWQAVRVPQQKSFHPNVYAEYIPYLRQAVDDKLERWTGFARSGETIEMVEETWTLAADMICRALFNREMPFNPHAVYKAVKAYTNVDNHKEIRLKKKSGVLTEVTPKEAAAKAIGDWLSIPDSIIEGDSWQAREKTLLTVFDEVVADPDIPEWDHQRMVDENLPLAGKKV